MDNWIIVLILAAIVAAIIVYLVRGKKRGEKCVGCPYCKQCGSGGNSCSTKEDRHENK